MKHHLENDLMDQNQNWSPDSDKLAGMLSKAHQQADQIRSRRQKAIVALTLCFCIGLVYMGQPSQTATSPPTTMADTSPNPSSKAPLQEIAYTKEDNDSLEAIVQSEYLSSDDFDFIQDNSSFPWDRLLAEF